MGAVLNKIKNFKNYNLLPPTCSGIIMKWHQSFWFAQVKDTFAPFLICSLLCPLRKCRGKNCKCLKLEQRLIWPIKNFYQFVNCHCKHQVTLLRSIFIQEVWKYWYLVSHILLNLFMLQASHFPVSLQQPLSWCNKLAQAVWEVTIQLWDTSLQPRHTDWACEATGFISAQRKTLLPKSSSII